MKHGYSLWCFTKHIPKTFFLCGNHRPVCNCIPYMSVVEAPVYSGLYSITPVKGACTHVHVYGWNYPSMNSLYIVLLLHKCAWSFWFWCAAVTIAH